MMSGIRILLLFIAPALLLAETAAAGGKTISVALTTGASYRGELITVDTGSILLYTGKESLSDDEIITAESTLVRIPISQLTWIRSEGTSRVVAGVLVGTGLGLVGGAIALASETKSEIEKNPATGWLTGPAEGSVAFAAFLLGGIAVGTITGIALSSGDLDIGSFDRASLASLAADARFPRGIPTGVKRGMHQ